MINQGLLFSVVNKVCGSQIVIGGSQPVCVSPQKSSELTDADSCQDCIMITLFSVGSSKHIELGILLA